MLFNGKGPIRGELVVPIFTLFEVKVIVIGEERKGVLVKICLNGDVRMI